MKNDLQSYAEGKLAEEVNYCITGFVEISDAVGAVENLESDFDGDSFCPYYSEQDEVIRDYESDFGTEAEEICDYEKTYKASEYRQAWSAYAYAIAYCGFQSYFQAAKDELVEALGEFESDVWTELKTDQEVKVQLTDNQCPHGWAAHDRELEDGTMIWESGQLDGCNGIAREVVGVWISCCIPPTENAKAEQVAA